MRQSQPIESAKPDSSSSLNLFAGGGEMGALMRAMDWKQTSLGPVEGWPEHLRSALGICLNAQFPMAIYWGDDRILLYNDAWRPIVGDKHPWAMARPAIEVWSEIWATIDPLFKQVQQTGTGTFSSDQLLLMHRHGYTEECYFDFTFSPLKDNNGAVGGILNVVQETTWRVINDRRSRLLRDLASMTGSGTTIEEVGRLTIEALGTDPQDIPFAILYFVTQDEEQACLAGQVGLSEQQSIVPEQIALNANDDGLWPIAEAVRGGRPLTLRDISSRLQPGTFKHWPEECETAQVLPIYTVVSGGTTAVLVAGVSSRRALDEQYIDFYKLVSGHIASAISNAGMLEAERKRAEAFAEIDRAKTDFFSNVSHEFRTPLTLMLGPLEDTLSTSGLTTENQERLNIAHRNTLRLQKLVNTLLDFSRLEAGRIEASFQPTDIATYTAELASMFQSAVDKAGLRLKIDCPKLPEPIYIDRDMWEKIVLNLLSNAFKYTFEGEIGVSVEQVGKEILLTVRDTGIGMSANELPKLFNRFYRVPDTRARTHEGSGIGLALVHDLIKLHGGSIQVESELNKGSVFVVHIPTGKAHLPANCIEAQPVLPSTAITPDTFVDEAMGWLPDEIASTRQDAESLLFDGILAQRAIQHWQRDLSGQRLSVPKTRARVILADDNADMREYICSLLAPHYQVEAVSDGIQAIEAAHREPPDLLLSDIMMPRMDGLELLNAFRSDPGLQRIPIILLSAQAGEEATVEGLQAGADDYLTKPFNARELLARVKASLDLHLLRQESVEREQLALEVVDSIRSELDLDRILQKAVTHLGRLSQADRCAFWLYDPETGEFQPPRFEYHSEELVASIDVNAYLGAPVLPHRLSHEAIVSFPDILKVDGLNDEDRQMIRERKIKSLLHVPIHYQEQLLGTLRIHTIFEKRYWGQEIISLISYLGKQIAIAIYHAQLLERLKETEARKTAILESSLDAITTMNHEGRVVDWNAAAEQLFGYDREEAIGQELASLIIPERLRQAHHQGLANYLKTGHGPIMDRKLEMPALRKGGHEFLAELTISRTPTQGLPLFTGTLRDITEIKQASDALQRSLEREQLIRRIAELTNQTFDIDGLLNTFASEIGNFYKVDRCFIVRYTQEEDYLNFSVHGEYYRSDLPPLDMSDFPPEVMRVFTHNLPIATAMRFQRFDTQSEYIADLKKRLEDYTYLSAEEREKYFEYFKNILAGKHDTHAVLRVGIQYRNRPYGVITLQQCGEGRHWTDGEAALLKDIATQIGVAFYQTELYRQEQETAIREQQARQSLEGYTRRLESSNRELEQFATIASHDLQEPLRKIQIFSEMLIPESNSDISKDYLLRMNAAANRMRILLDDLLSLSRVNRKGKPFRQVDLTEALHTVLDDMQISIQETHAQITVTPLGSVYADEGQIRQLFQNLIGNALKYRQPGSSPVIHISGEATPDKRYYRTTVTDEGIGIRPEYREQIFEPFRRLHTFDKYTGTGIGLTICKKIIDRHGGTMTVEGEPGQGSQFSFTLPSCIT